LGDDEPGKGDGESPGRHKEYFLKRQGGNVVPGVFMPAKK